APDDKSITSLFVLGLDQSVTQADLRDHFIAFGELKSVVVVPKGNCAFINYKNRAGAEAAALAALSGFTIKDKSLKVTWGKPKPKGPKSELAQANVISKEVTAPTGSQPPTRASIPLPPGARNDSALYPSQDPTAQGAYSKDTYTSIAVVGTGGYGELFLKALKQCGYFVKIRAVTRAPEATEAVKLERLKQLRALGIEVLEYADTTADGFSTVFAGIDTVVSAVGVAGLPSQIPMIDGAIAAGVKWFIPSEYGVAHYNSAWMPFKGPLAAKGEVLDYLVGTAKPKGLAYTAIYTGLALDYLDPHGIGLKLSKRRATLV
ncbi:Pre-mRNA-splicing factor slt11, partial [Coemansia sp. S142-1]